MKNLSIYGSVKIRNPKAVFVKSNIRMTGRKEGVSAGFCAMCGMILLIVSSPVVYHA